MEDFCEYSSPRKRNIKLKGATRRTGTKGKRKYRDKDIK